MGRGKVAFIVSKTVAFIPNPDEYRTWLRVHPCVLLADCPGLIGCGAKKGERCKSYSSNEHVNYAHHVRVNEVTWGMMQFPTTWPLEQK